MARQKRIRLLIAVIAIVAVALVVVDVSRRNQAEVAPLDSSDVSQEPGTIALYHNGAFVTFFTSAALDGLETYGFEEAEESKLQSGALLRDVILLYVDEATLQADTQITVSSSEREKSVTLVWADVANVENHVLFDPSSNRSTLKLVSSTLENLDSRSEWIQDTDRIDIETP